jgi:hypothetical protein
MEKKLFQLKNEYILINFDHLIKSNPFPLKEISKLILDSPAVLVNQLPFKLNARECNSEVCRYG